MAVRPNGQIVERLAGEGLAVVDGVVPAVTGTLSDEDAEVLASLADGLKVFRGQRLADVFYVNVRDLFLETVTKYGCP